MATECYSQLGFGFQPKLVVDFAGGTLTTDAGLLLVREFDEHLGLSADVVGRITDLRDARYITHALDALVRQRLYQIAAGYEDVNDGDRMLSKLVLPGMMEGRRGAIVNISSGAAIGPGRAPFKDGRRGGTMYGATKAALERFTQGLAHEVDGYNIAVTAVSPSQVVPTPGTVYHKLVSDMADPRGEPPIYMARAALLLATEPAEKINGRVTYSQQILGEYGLIEKPTGRGVTTPGTGYSQI